MTSTVAATSLAHGGALPALTGIRFIAALWVLAYHLLRPWLSTQDQGTSVVRDGIVASCISLASPPFADGPARWSR